MSTATTSNNIINDNEIRSEDILCGKKKHEVNHPGSKNFRAVIEDYAPKYQTAITKQEKMAVTKEIYDSLSNQNSRFLKYSNDLQGWEEISSLLARDKISHALRFANRDKKKGSKKSHRRTGSDATLETVATELSQDDFDFLLDTEPLDINADPEPLPYAYPVFEEQYAAPAANYPHPQEYGYGSQPYYTQHYAPQYEHKIESTEPLHFTVQAPMPQSEPLVQRESSMDIDLSFIMDEQFMDFDMELEQ